jgi:hypothetical protein
MKKRQAIIFFVINLFLNNNLIFADVEGEKILTKMENIEKEYEKRKNADLKDLLFQLLKAKNDNEAYVKLAKLIQPELKRIDYSKCQIQGSYGSIDNSFTNKQKEEDLRSFLNGPYQLATRQIANLSQRTFLETLNYGDEVVKSPITFQSISASTFETKIDVKYVLGESSGIYAGGNISIEYNFNTNELRSIKLDYNYADNEIRSTHSISCSL